MVQWKSGCDYYLLSYEHLYLRNLIKHFKENCLAPETLLRTQCSIILEVITDQCSAFDLIKKIEVLAAEMEVHFIFNGQLDYK